MAKVGCNGPDGRNSLGEGMMVKVRGNGFVGWRAMPEVGGDV